MFRRRGSGQNCAHLPGISERRSGPLVDPVHRKTKEKLWDLQQQAPLGTLPHTQEQGTFHNPISLCRRRVRSCGLFANWRLPSLIYAFFPTAGAA
jgi:hypothetical protein